VDGSLWVYLLLGLTFSVVVSVGGLALMSLLIVRLPADYFRNPAPPRFWVGRHPFIRRTGLIVKNLVGGVLVLLGVLLSLPGIPGPGILTIVIGVILLDFPGKRRLEVWLISRSTIWETINRLRRRYGKAPLDRPQSM
jgi:hypothetical protein